MSYRPPVLQATSVPSNTAVDGSIPTSAATATRDAAIQATRTADATVDANAGTMQQADAQRAMPRARTDNLNDAAGRHLTPTNETVERPSVYSHRTNRANVNRAAARFNPAQRTAAATFINPQTDQQRQIRNGLNSHFESGGSVNDLLPATQRLVRRLDGAIQKAERENDRSHVVYTTLNVQGTSRDDYLQALNNTPNYHQNLLGYTRANHDVNKIAGDQDAIYVQIETSRGMYVGNEGSTGHLLPRGLELEYVGSGDFNVDDGQGGTVRRTIVQMREVRQDERTAARS